MIHSTSDAARGGRATTLSPLSVLFGCAIALVLSIFACAALFFLVLSAIGSNSDFGPSSRQSRASSPPNTVEGGRETFERRCSGCHSTGTDVKFGPGLTGLFEPGGPTLPEGFDYGGKLPNGADINEANVAAWIRSGGKGQIGPMPAQQLSDDELTGIVAYLKTLQR